MGASDGSQVGKLGEKVTSHTSARMRMIEPSAGERAGVRAGETRAGTINTGVWIGPEVRSRDQKQMIAVEKTWKGTVMARDLVEGELSMGGFRWRSVML